MKVGRFQEEMSVSPMTLVLFALYSATFYHDNNLALIVPHSSGSKQEEKALAS